MPGRYAVTDYQSGMNNIGSMIASIPGQIQQGRASQANLEASKASTDKDRKLLSQLDESIKYNKNHNTELYRDAVAKATQMFGEDVAKTIPAPGDTDPKAYSEMIGTSLIKIAQGNGMKNPQEIKDFFYSTIGNAEQATGMIDNAQESNAKNWIDKTRTQSPGTGSNLGTVAPGGDPGTSDLEGILKNIPSKAGNLGAGTSAPVSQPVTQPAQNNLGVSAGMDGGFYDGLPKEVVDQINTVFDASASPGEARKEAMKIKNDYLKADLQLKKTEASARQLAEEEHKRQIEQKKVPTTHISVNGTGDDKTLGLQEKYADNVQRALEAQSQTLSLYGQGKIEESEKNRLMAQYDTIIRDSRDRSGMKDEAITPEVRGSVKQAAAQLVQQMRARVDAKFPLDDEKNSNRNSSNHFESMAQEIYNAAREMRVTTAGIDKIKEALQTKTYEQTLEAIMLRQIKG
jgi:hypothetical protein